jgi:aspartyl-tRNA synthetase
MSFARREDVMILVERLIAQTIWPGVGNKMPFEKGLQNDPPIGAAAYSPDTKILFPQYTYHQAMSLYGSDKPDPRLGSEIHRVDDWVPQNLKGMLSSLEDPIIEMMKIDMQGNNVRTSSEFITTFLDAASSAVYIDNPAGTPGITVYDPKKPVNGLASFGHDGAAKAEELLRPEPGDIIVVQARPKAPFTGGSTPLGNLRRDVHQSAVAQGLCTLPKYDSFVWVTDFPLFSPIEDDAGAPGQDGAAGICSTHHPFTAPRSDQDLTKLYTAPLSVIGDHYDLVINGVEVGGGSRRIHDAQMQELIFRDVLRMKKHRIEDFRHLLVALESGCPPHAGFALGFDRLMALALRRGSVRDVIAFPKWGSGGEDKMVGAPSRMSEEVLETYHLRVRDGDGGDAKSGVGNVSKRV